MRRWFDRVAVNLAFLHARRTQARFQRALADPRRAEQRVLRSVLGLVGRSDFGRRHKLQSVRSRADLARAVPIRDYEGLRPWIERAADGDTSALFFPSTRIVMFATTSGTTSRRKLIPVTSPYVNDYRRGWNVFGLKMLSDHPRAILRAILQSSGRYDETRTRGGVPVGAITGLLARTQKRIVRRYYVGTPDIAYLDDPQARYYALARFGIVRDVAFAITANPATFIRIAQTVDAESERLIRDVHDGTLSAEFVPDATLRRRLSLTLRPARERARRLQLLRRTQGRLAPRDYWNLEFLACWTGGSMGYHLRAVREWYGNLPIRDPGLIASEGRVTLPLADNTPEGVLDATSGLFEFIPAAEMDASQPVSLSPEELRTGDDYCVVLTNSSGLVRYRLNDVVRVKGWHGGVPILEFLYRGGGVASVSGEKLTENQVVDAVRAVSESQACAHYDFVVAPCWDDPPFYRISCTRELPAHFAESLDQALCQRNAEYAERRLSGRLACLQVRSIPEDAILRMDLRLMTARGSSAEQYKRTCLFQRPGDDDAALAIPR
jgi:hypothetical protein